MPDDPSRTEPGTWTIYFAHDTGHAEQIDVTIDSDGPDPSQHEVNQTFSLIYRDGRVRIFPWTAIREARWNPAK